MLKEGDAKLAEKSDSVMNKEMMNMNEKMNEYEFDGRRCKSTEKSDSDMNRENDEYE